MLIKIQVLLIEDNVDYADFLKLILNQPDYQSSSNISSEFMLTHAKQLIPDSEGLASLTKLLPKSQNIPIIVLSAVLDEKLALKSMQEGAQDYIVKGKMDQYLIKRSIRYTIERYSLYTKFNFQAKLLLHIPDAIFSTNVDFKIQSWNVGAEELYGWKTQEVLGKESIS